MREKMKYIIRVTDESRSKYYYAEPKNKHTFELNSIPFIGKLFDTYEEAEKTAKIVKKSIRKTSKVEIMCTKG